MNDLGALASRLIALEDGQSRALVYPERGFQLYGFETTVAGQRVELLHAPPVDREPADRRYGNPVLFPAVGVSNGSRPDSWDHGGHALPMPPHGWARNVYWQLEGIAATSLTALLVPHPGFRLGFPFDFELRLTYRLQEGALTLESTLTNAGSSAFPYAYGFHPYLRAPILPGGARERCLVRVPAGTRLQSADGWRTVTREVAAARALASRSPELPGSVVLEKTGATSLEIEDETAGLAARVSVEGSEQSFPVWVVWSATPDAPYVCLEPWTDAPNALNRPGTRTLDPGGTHRYRMALSARKL
jgi:galactose mutarotase-like enzyme